jgi:hypothetical protein
LQLLHLRRLHLLPCLAAASVAATAEALQIKATSKTTPASHTIFAAAVP